MDARTDKFFNYASCQYKPLEDLYLKLPLTPVHHYQDLFYCVARL